MKNNKLILLTVVIYTLLLAWFFKDENTCVFDNYKFVCVSYNRITGEWTIPIDEHYTITTERKKPAAPDEVPVAEAE